jgi:predicted phosphodiesterase
MKLLVLSDLHLSVQGMPPPQADADVVVLAGDVARPAQAIAWAQSLGKPVLYVPGNHEFYGGSIEGTRRELKRLAEGTQVRILDNDEHRIGQVRFLGSTLWSDFLIDGPGAPRERAVTQALRDVHDFRRIRLDDDGEALFTPDASAALFDANAAWLQERLRTPWAGPTVVVTHHAPSPRSVHPRFVGSPLNACFASDLERLLNGELAGLWIHGHMHHSVDYEVRGTRVLCNPRGYGRDGVNENAAFDPGLVVEVG